MTYPCPSELKSLCLHLDSLHYGQLVSLLWSMRTLRPPLSQGHCTGFSFSLEYSFLRSVSFSHPLTTWAQVWSFLTRTVTAYTLKHCISTRVPRVLFLFFLLLFFYPWHYHFLTYPVIFKFFVLFLLSDFTFNFQNVLFPEGINHCHFCTLVYPVCSIYIILLNNINERKMREDRQK